MATRRRHAELVPVDTTVQLAPPGWYSGDTHEHVQACDETLHPIEEIRARMDAEDLNVANVLIWERVTLRYTQFVCRVNGQRDPSSGERRILVYGVETSGLACARWGHLIGLGIGAAQARIVRGTLAAGDCADMEGLELGEDGSGTLSHPVAEHFRGARKAVTGYAHTVWSLGLYHPAGEDWNAELLGSGFTTDARYLDPAQKLAVPSIRKLMGLEPAAPSLRAFFPLLAAMDVVLGNVDFLETVIVASTLPIPTIPPAHWREPWSKLMSAGARPVLAAGTDRECLQELTGPELARTYVLTEQALTHEAWLRGLAAGRTTLAAGPNVFVRLSVGGREVGAQLALETPDHRRDIHVEVTSRTALTDVVELVVGGEVVATKPVVLAGSGTALASFLAHEFPASAWVAARLASGRAQTSAVFVHVDGRPIAAPQYAEYWMLWCDLVAKTTLDHPELPFFGAQRDEALALIAKARRAFQTHRDVAGFDPSWGVTRHGRGTPGPLGPLAIGSTGPARTDLPFRITCVHAPPLAQGTLYLSRVQDLAGTCDGEVRLHVDLAPASVVATYAAYSTRSGYAEVEVDPAPAGVARLHAQWVWNLPAGRTVPGCAGAPATRCTSDALEMIVA
jgi:hypothetical protein